MSTAETAFGRRAAVVLAVLLLPALGGAAALAADSAPAAGVSVRESGPTYRTGWREGHKDHKWEERSIGLDTGRALYTLKYSACVDPSHPGVRALEEGYIGMPTPTAANWYHSGFFFIRVNGKEVGEFPLADMRVTERGARAACHMVWDTPDARVRVQFLVKGGSERLLSQVTCVPVTGHTVESVEFKFTCYPSFFTAHHHRQGDRTLITPRTEAHEPSTTALDPVADTYLLFEDTVFDVAKGEGDGPCAMLFLPEPIAAGTVQLSNYPVQTTLKAAPGALRFRFVFWDFQKRTNAEAAAFLKENGAAARDELRQTEFRPELLVAFDAAGAQAELQGLLAAAAEDGQRLKAAGEGLMRKLTELRQRADADDWSAEAEFAAAYADYEAFLWKLRIYALLNSAPAAAAPAVRD